ncbi:hypothetical protein PPL_00842 [Heterostelium album PN500]|uniref:Uncharacterized protein n=1 Tax=Heterostelium pallidum (strain ATCC 26659 / Pp 5 / PN500) TaxID=670386 RepID=D3AXL1_HETP5|nr:hypothetical protein PPL_00842 [Heterostelium album PN500]EFA86280.1 hypothetical protein PPL_00842 [Heterostelium album PN500]|eukprot:XP_020438385.1 hypothetical protein PPL_00842 [Heterostelium album PN500]
MSLLMAIGHTSMVRAKNRIRFKSVDKPSTHRTFKVDIEKTELSKAIKIVQAEQVLVDNGYDTNDHQEDDDEAEEEEESEVEEEDPVVSKKKAKQHLSLNDTRKD